MKRLVLALAVKTLFCLTACGSANNEEVRETALPPANENPSGSDAISDKWWLSGEYAKGSIFVDAIPGLSPDFIRGADISSLLSLEESGVKFYGFDGNEQDMLKTMSEAAFNYIRVRVWNDPFDENGNGYGGGNCNAQTAAILGKRAADYGMKLLVDFHYSDFWADPGKQQAPKAWENMDINEKEKALYDYTVESLRTIIDAGADVGMVQIGNETTGGFCGEKSWPRICVLMASGARAVRAVALETGKDIEIVIHLTNPESHNFSQTARLLEVNNVDYDIFATSYYSFWHGSLENMTEKLAEIAAVYGKKVMVAEVAYAYSYEDFDGHANTIGDGATFDKQYPLTVQGQARAVYDVVEAVASLGEKGIGVFYWEPAWIPVPGDSHEERFKLWEKFGSGWASSYASEYDPDDAGIWYGGSACDNQALFDAYGHPLESLKVFGYCYTGSTTDLRLDEVSDAYVSFRLKNPITLPDKVMAVFNNGIAEEVEVVWSNDIDLDEISFSPVGVYRVKGEAMGVPVVCHIKMEEENYLENPSFENEDRSMWELIDLGDTTQFRFQEKSMDAASGLYSVHFWDEKYVELIVQQTVTGLKPGAYSFALFLQGGDTKNDEIYIFAIADGVRYRFDTAVDGWVNWQEPKIDSILTESGEITVGIYIKSDGGWGTMDDFRLCPIEE